MSIEDAKRVILTELLADFKHRNLGSAELQSEYVGPPLNSLEQACLIQNICKVDLDLAIDELANSDSIGTGPLEMSEAYVSTSLVIPPMPYRKRDYVFLREKGYKAAAGSSGRSSKPSVIFHGDQIVNYGNAGAIGRHSTGAINQQQQWASVANQVDLSQVVTELETLRTELIKTAKTLTDFQHLALVAEAEQHAEQHDGPKLMEALSKTGKWLLDFATHVGTDITAKLVAKAMGLESPHA